MAPGHVEDCSVPRKRHKPEAIVTKLRQIGVLTAQGRTVAKAIRSIARLIKDDQADDELGTDALEAIDRLLRSEAVKRAIADT